MEVIINLENVFQKEKTILFKGNMIKNQDFYEFKDLLGFNTRLDFSFNKLHLIREADYRLELYIANDSFLKITSKEGEVDLPLRVIDYRYNETETVLKYELEKEIFIYTIRRNYVTEKSYD